MSAIIETGELTRELPACRTEYRRRRGRRVDRPDLRVEAGESVGYIGANGAGKSTTIKMLAGILVPTSGRSARGAATRSAASAARARGRRGVRAAFAAVVGPAGAGVVPILAAIHSLSAADGDVRTAELVEMLEMGEFLATPVRQLSLGQRMRAEVAAALLHPPRLLILDEPTIGLDVLSKQRLREFLIAERREHGTTLLLTTHDMGDVERLCDRILVVDHGRLAFDGTLAGLARTVGARRELVVDLDRATPRPGRIRDTRHVGSECGGLRQRLAFDPKPRRRRRCWRRSPRARGARPVDHRARHRGRRPPNLCGVPDWPVTAAPPREMAGGGKLGSRRGQHDE